MGAKVIEKPHLILSKGEDLRNVILEPSRLGKGRVRPTKNPAINRVIFYSFYVVRLPYCP
jgi:hypothetical protein